MSTRDHSVPVPRPPDPRPAWQFPFFATIAPVAASCALFAFTSSPFALIFAVLGPVAAVASMLDSRWHGIRHHRTESLRFEREVLEARERIAKEQGQERDRLIRLTPSAAELVQGGTHRLSRWKGTLREKVAVTIGTGSIPFDVISSRERNDGTRATEELVAEATLIDNAPVIVDARHGIAILGPQRQALAIVDALVVQLAHVLGPNEAQVWFSSHPALSWLNGLPHSFAEHALSSAQVLVEFRSRSSDSVVRIAACDEEKLIPRECRIVVRTGGGAVSEVLAHPEDSQLGEFSPEFVSIAQARRFVVALAAEAEALSEGSENSLPDRVAFADLEHAPSTTIGSLACPLGVGEHGVDVVDLVADGPHALVGGMTGSGKSELLVGWVLAMAASYPATAVNFLLVDFKGGASFRAISSLQHCVGVVTDLEHSGARRALESLSAELRRREQLLADHGASSIDDLRSDSALARLVIVVDEFATLAATLPELQELFADIAARGRSLGLHLILCTQRPSGVVRDVVSANCSLRVSLRVNNAADSVAVIGSVAAAELSRKARGRAIIAAGDDGRRTVQCALASSADIDRVVARWPATEVFQPWRKPLATRIGLDELHGFDDSPDRTGIPFAVLDLPAKQRQSVLRYKQSAHGSVFVVGARHSGKTGVLSALEQSTARSGQPVVRWLPSTPEGAWDAVTEQLAQIRHGSPESGVMLLDDVDIVIAQLGDDYAHSFVDSLVAIIREGGAVGAHTVVTASRISAGVQTIADACENTVLLRTGGVQDHLLAGGDRVAFDSRLPAGGGFWRGERIQVVHVPHGRAPLAQPSDKLSVERQLAVVSGTPHAIQHRLAALGAVTVLGPRRVEDVLTDSAPRIFLGDPDAWQSDWSLMTALRQTTPVAFHRCTPAQFRMITRSAVLPPPLASPDDTLWVAMPDGSLSRARLSGRN